MMAAARKLCKHPPPPQKKRGGLLCDSSVHRYVYPSSGPNLHELDHKMKTSPPYYM